jgi:glycosyltransferase involved in cell wall biosynthesis
VRDALTDYKHVASHIALEGVRAGEPLVTIAIPTFRRPHLLVETVRSAMAQAFSRPFEIVVVDNDPESIGAQLLQKALPELRERQFRYLVNAENIGMFGNFNRCVEVANSEWLSILNDDDLLDPEFLQSMFAVLDKDNSIDGIICKKRQLDQRAVKGEKPRSLPRRIAARLLTESNFAGALTRKVNGRKLFWWPGGVVGNGAGFLFRKQAAVQIGGFYPEEEMAADYWFFARFARMFHFRQHRVTCASVRIAENESANYSTLLSFLRMTYLLQQALAQDDVPSRWRRFSPMIMARQRAFYRDYWKVDIPDDEVERMLDIKLPRDRPLLFRIVRLAMRGF